MTQGARGALAVALAALVFGREVPAGEPDELMAGEIAVIRTGKLAKIVAHPVTSKVTFDLPDPANDPLTGGAVLRVLDESAPGAGDNSFTLAPGGWKAFGNPSKPRGYKYRGAGSSTDPCELVLLKRRLVKAICRGESVSLTPPFVGGVAVVLTVGGGSKRYCASFGGNTVRNKTGVTKRKEASAPSACAVPDCTSCDCGATEPTRLEFVNAVGVGSCGTLTGGTVNNNLACGGLYFGGGGPASTPLPATVPDFALPTVMNVSCCAGKQLFLTASTDAETGGARKSCTTAGCFFGPPLPIPNVTSSPTSTCVINIVSQNGAGTASCDTGTALIDLPLQAGVHLTGDVLPRRCAAGTNPGGRCTTATELTDCPGGGPGSCVADPGLQPCPICNPVTNVCNGGPRNNLPCVPGSVDAVGDQFPVSHDCPPPSVLKIGELPIPFALTTGTSTDTAGPSGTQQKVFCGYCRDANDTGSFQGPPAVACQSDADCVEPYEACEQADTGAFRNTQATVITEIGAAAGSLEDHNGHPATLVSVFCIPLTFNGLIDSSANLPGPGAVALPGTMRLVP